MAAQDSRTRAPADTAGDIQTPDGGVAPANTGSRGKIFLLIALAVAIIGGGAGFFVWRASGADAASIASPVVQRQPLLFYSMDPPFVANFEGNQGYRFLQVTVRVATRDAVLMSLLKDNEPVFRNDLLMLFSAQQAALLATSEGKEALRDDATQVLKDSVASLGGDPETVERLLFTSLVMQ